MIIGTYNIWNEDMNFEKRVELLIEEINRNHFDYLGLQEVKNEDVFLRIKNQCGFQFGYYYEGLGLLCREELSIVKTYNECNNYLLRLKNKEMGLTIVHFDWSDKENRISGLDAYLTMLEEEMLETEIILGDFNDNDESEVHYELVISDFVDLHQAFCHHKSEVPLPTLDTIHNPRWRNSQTIEQPERFDWVMMNSIVDYDIHQVDLIGVKEVDGMTPSDHYGVKVEFAFKEQSGNI